MNKIYLKGKKLEKLSSDLDYPCDFGDLKIFKVRVDDINKAVEIVASNIQSKMILMTIWELPEAEKESWVAPLLHM